jgi:uncharacterized protein YecE (DUF72 family)
MRLNIGQSVMLGTFAQYVRHFDLLELRAEPGKIPRPSRLEQWASQAPEGFVFSVAVAPSVAALETREPPEADLAFAFTAADALKATWWIVKTPASVTPGRLGRQRLASLTERLMLAGRRVAWDPAGPWAPEQAERFAVELGVTLVRDAARGQLPPSSRAYTRLRAFASGGRLRTSAVLRAAGHLVGHEEVVVVLEGRGAAVAARSLREQIAHELSTSGSWADTDEGSRPAEAEEP